MAVKANLIIDQGSDYNVTIDVQYANGTSYDLSGFTGRAQMRKSPFSSTNYDFTVTTANSGTVTLEMTSAYTANVTAGRYLYDVEVISSANVVTRVLQGIATVSPEITK